LKDECERVEATPEKMPAWDDDEYIPWDQQWGDGNFSVADASTRQEGDCNRRSSAMTGVSPRKELFSEIAASKEGSPYDNEEADTDTTQEPEPFPVRLLVDTAQSRALTKTFVVGDFVTVCKDFQHVKHLAMSDGRSMVKHGWMGIVRALNGKGDALITFASRNQDLISRWWRGELYPKCLFVSGHDLCFDLHVRKSDFCNLELLQVLKQPGCGYVYYNPITGAAHRYNNLLVYLPKTPPQVKVVVNQYYEGERYDDLVALPYTLKSDGNNNWFAALHSQANMVEVKLLEDELDTPHPGWHLGDWHISFGSEYVAGDDRGEMSCDGRVIAYKQGKYPVPWGGGLRGGVDDGTGYVRFVIGLVDSDAMVPDSVTAEPEVISENDVDILDGTRQHAQKPMPRSFRIQESTPSERTHVSRSGRSMQEYLKCPSSLETQNVNDPFGRPWPSHLSKEDKNNWRECERRRAAERIRKQIVPFAPCHLYLYEP